LPKHVEELATGRCLAKITHAPTRNRLFTCFGVIVSGDKKDRGRVALCGELISQVNSGHSGELNVKHEAVKTGMLYIREEALRGRICRRLHTRSTQKAGERTEQVFVIVDNADLELV